MKVGLKGTSGIPEETSFWRRRKQGFLSQVCPAKKTGDRVSLKQEMVKISGQVVFCGIAKALFEN